MIVKSERNLTIEMLQKAFKVIEEKNIYPTPPHPVIVSMDFWKLVVKLSKEETK